MSGTNNAAGAGQPSLVSRNRLLMLVGTMSAMIMYTLDSTVANVALPHMAPSLSASQDTITWVLTSYVLAAAVALPLAGWLVDTVGIRRLMLVSVVLFTVASMLCGAARSIEEMVLFRILQGIAGAFISPVAQTITLDSSTPAERPKMMAIYTQGVMIGPITGPIIGGYLTDTYNWRWVFYVNVPIGIMCFALLFFYLPKTDVHKRRIDIRGWFLVAVAVSAFQLLLDRGQTKDWFSSGEIVIYAVLAASALWMALVHLVTTDHPLFPAALFRDANFVAGMGFMFVMGLVVLTVTALLPGLMQEIYGYTPMQSGVLLCWRGVSLVAVITLFSKAMGRIDPRLLLGLGLFLTGVSMIMMSRWSLVMPRQPIVVAALIQGAGLAVAFMPMNLITFATLPTALRTDASSLANLMRNIGSSIGISAATVALTRNIQINHAEVGSRVTTESLPVDPNIILGSGSSGEAAMRMLDGMVNQQAAMLSYINDFYALGIVCFISIGLLFFVRPAKGGAAGAIAANAASEAMH